MCLHEVAQEVLILQSSLDSKVRLYFYRAIMGYHLPPGMCCGMKRNANDSLKSVLFAFWSNSTPILNLPLNLAWLSLNVIKRRKGRNRDASKDKNVLMHSVKLEVSGYPFLKKLII